LYAPIKRGETLGKAVYRQGDKVLSEKELLAQCDILKTEPPKRDIEIIINNFKYILKNL
jgi:hypothetical protein